MREIIDNIRKNALKDVLKLIVPVVLLSGGFIMMLYMTFYDEFDGGYLFLSAIFGLFTIPSIITLFKKIGLLIDPFKSDVFKKYGDPEKIARIYAEIEQTVEYENDTMIVSKNYICDKKRADVLIACNDVLAIHQLVHKTNFIVDYYNIVITDKYGEEYHFTYKAKQEQECLNVLKFIAGKCKNAEIGYTQDELDHIRKNKISLKDNPSGTTNKTFTATFKSDAQKKAEQDRRDKNKSIVTKILKYLGCFALGILSSELILMIIVGDSIEGGAALLLLFVVAIPVSFLYYYLFVGRKNAYSSNPKNQNTQQTSSYSNLFPNSEIHRKQNVDTKSISDKRAEELLRSLMDDDSTSHNQNAEQPTNSTNTEVRFCRKCGNRLTVGSLFCNKCGTKIDSDN